MKKTQFGIMQGRIFPESYKDYNKFPKLWKKEFFATKKIGYNYLSKTANIQYCSIEFLKGLMKATISKYVSKQKIVIDFPFH